MMWRQSVLIGEELALDIWKKLTIASIPWIYSEHAHLLCNFTPEMGVLPLFEVVCLHDYWWCGDSWCWFVKRFFGDMKKINNMSIPWIYSEHAHLLCSFTPEKGQPPPLWSCLCPQFLMILRQSALTCIKLMLEIWKKLTITSILWIYSEHAHHLYSFTPELGKPFLFEVVCLCDYWWCRGIQHWFAKS